MADVLDSVLKMPWRHAREAEEAIIGSGDPDAARYAVFERNASDSIRSARLVLYGDRAGYTLANIVPTDEGPDLGEDGYNDVLNDFVRRVAEPAMARGVSLKLTDRRQTITDWTTDEAAHALRQFSIMANKATGTSHPMDAARWRAFLIADHRAPPGKLTSYNLQRWLVEVEKWPEEEAQDLVTDRDKALELLEDYDNT